jgi:hypothetical protein
MTGFLVGSVASRRFAPLERFRHAARPMGRQGILAVGRDASMSRYRTATLLTPGDRASSADEPDGRDGRPSRLRIPRAAGRQANETFVRTRLPGVQACAAPVDDDRAMVLPGQRREQPADDVREQGVWRPGRIRPRRDRSTRAVRPPSPARWSGTPDRAVRRAPAGGPSARDRVRPGGRPPRPRCRCRPRRGCASPPAGRAPGRPCGS